MEAVPAIMMRLLARFLRTSQFNARSWSNEELAKFAPLFSGKVVNISGGGDSDKGGRRYRDYFTASSEYSVSNYGKLAGLENEFALDLELKVLPGELKDRFDVAFSHTVLEHVYDFETAVANLVAMSSDVVITVVPFLQSFHHDEWYSDYWRFSPAVLKRVFDNHGLKTLYLTWNEDPLGNLYVFHIASKRPAQWTAISQRQPSLTHGPGVRRSRLLYGNAGIEKATIDLSGRF